MSKDKVSEWSSTPSNNTDIGGINIAEGCAPSGINNAIRELMAQVKDMQAGTDADNFAVGGTLSVTGNTTLSNTLTVNSSVGTANQALLSRGAGLSPQWGTLNLLVTGMIVMWSGTIATIPSGWVLCDGTNSTPDLRDKFIIGARQDESSTAKTNVTGSLTQTGGSKDAITVSHTHTATSSPHQHSSIGYNGTGNVPYGTLSGQSSMGMWSPANNSTTHVLTSPATVSVTVDSAGSSGTNANLVPYFALAFIMKT